MSGLSPSVGSTAGGTQVVIFGKGGHHVAGMSASRNPSGLPNIGRTLVSARSFDEYVAMFALSSEDLASTILDCPGGAASSVQGR